MRKIIFDLGESGEKTNLGVFAAGKGGRHLSVPFDSTTANGDLSEYIFFPKSLDFYL